jgi:hypothetical protein
VSADSATIPVRRITIELNRRTADALARREAAEHLTPTTLFCRAMQVYDQVMTDHPEWVRDA